MTIILESDSQLEDNPSGWSKRIQVELEASKKEQEPWHAVAEEAVRMFRNEGSRLGGRKRLALFTSNIQTKRALLYGRTPQVDVARKFGDADDDIGRIAGEILERLLNSDIDTFDDTFSSALRHALDDWQIAACGTLRMRYVCETKEVGVPAQTGPNQLGEIVELAPAYTDTVKAHEDVETDYIHWRDIRWSPARVWEEVRWVAFKVLMTREQLIKRFGDKIGKLVPLSAKKGESDSDSVRRNDPWGKAEVWEFWDKERRKVFWYTKGYSETLDDVDDPLGLDGFWPMPQPLLANTTTTSLIPVPEWELTKDQYDKVDDLETKIHQVINAINVTGVYDKTVPEIENLLDGSNKNKLYPLENWMAFVEKGGLKGVIDWMPIEMLVAVLNVLRENQAEEITKSMQVSGMSDIMRGQAAAQATATEQAIKAKFASVRTQSAQDEFAKFASSAQAIKAEIISKHFDPETIAQRANAQYLYDAQQIGPAIQLIKSNFYQYRVNVRPEAVSLTDYAALKMERVEFLTALANFLQSAMPAAQGIPGSAKYFLQIIQWAMAGFKGGSQVEGILDQAILALDQQQQAPQQPPPPDPKMLQIQAKTQADMMKTAIGHKADLAKIQAETQAEAQRKATDVRFNLAQSEAEDRRSALRDVTSVTTSGATR